MEQPVEAIVHNSPALDSLKHQQLRSLCARHGLKSTGKKDHLIKRLKALRDRPSHAGCSPEASASEDAALLDSSFDMLDDEEAEEAQVHGCGSSLPGSFETARETGASIHSRASTDEFGTLSADSQTISRSSSWKDKLASVFGSAGVAPSSSSDSLSSIRTAKGATASLSRASESRSEQPQGQSTSQTSDAYSRNSAAIRHPSAAVHATKASSTLLTASEAPPTPAFRIVEDSFMQANSTYPDCSFVPRASFEGNSVDLANVPVWPPPPGVILISPRQSPNKATSTMAQVATTSRLPMSAQKRYLHDVEEDDDLYDGEEAERYGSIRMIPRTRLDSATTTPSRRIAALPKKMSIIAASPPRFDLEAPLLPSFATVANQALTGNLEQDHQGEEGDATIIMDEEHEVDTKPSSDTLESSYDGLPSQQRFVFGSPRQMPLTDDSFLKRIDGFAIAKQLEELQKRTGNVGSSSKGLPFGDAERLNKGYMPRTASSGNLQSKNPVRFDGKHDKEFTMMDSIANHYAARRKVSDSDTKSSRQMPNKRTRTESADATTSLGATRHHKPAQTRVHRQVSCPALSLNQTSSGSIGLNQQGRHAPIIPPRPKPVKTAAQQAEDRERIRKLQSTSAPIAPVVQRRAGRVSVSPRKAAGNPSTRKLPPLSVASSNTNSIGPNSSSGTASKLFKSTFSSLKSFGSSSSLSSKATLQSMTNSSSSRTIGTSTHQVSDFGALYDRIPASASGSVARPTIASLARQESRRNLDSLASPRQALSPRTDSASCKTNVVSPRSGIHGTVEKKKISSISAAHRNSPLKAISLDDSIAQARRIRAKKLGSQIQSSHSSALSTVPPLPHSPSKNVGYPSSIANTGSVNSRPAWR